MAIIEINDVKVRSSRSAIKVVIEQHCWQKINGWCKAANSEVSGWGLIVEEVVNDIRRYRVYDVFLPSQQCSSGYTDIDDEAASKLRFKKFKKGVPLNHWRFWWHTHYNFNVFWSGTDDATAEKLLKGNGDWLISLVVNQAGDWRMRYDTMYPTHMTVDELQVYTCPNTKKQKRKRNFKSDIRRWVRPLGQDIKDKMKGQEEGDTPTNSYTPVGGSTHFKQFEYDHKDLRTYDQQYEAWLDEMWPNRHAWKQNNPHWEFKDGEWHFKRQGSEDTKKEEPKKEDTSKGFNMGTKYAFHKGLGRLLPVEIYEKLISCTACGDASCEECKKNAGGYTEKKACTKCPHEGVKIWEECECETSCQDHCFDRIGKEGGMLFN